MIINLSSQLLADITGELRTPFDYLIEIMLFPITSVIYIVDEWNYLARNLKRKALTFCKDWFEIYFKSVCLEALSFYESSLMCQVYLKCMTYNTQQHSFNILK